MLKKAAVIGAGVIIGSMIFDNFIAGKLVAVEGGFGADDIVLAATIAATVLAIQQVL